MFYVTMEYLKFGKERSYELKLMLIMQFKVLLCLNRKTLYLYNSVVVTLKFGSQNQFILFHE